VVRISFVFILPTLPTKFGYGKIARPRRDTKAKTGVSSKRVCGLSQDPSEG
jgi:hypothetical protein